MTTIHKLLTGISLFLIMAGLFGCAGAGGAGLPTRKKMPEFNGYADDFEGAIPFERNTPSSNSADFAFSTGNIDLMLNGTPQGFISVSLPSAANDSLAVNLINSFKPFALPFISQWAHNEHKGVAINLSAHNGAEVHRSDFVLQRTDDFTIPVVVLWDAASAGRVGELQQLANGLPSVRFTKVASADAPAFGR